MADSAESKEPEESGKDKDPEAMAKLQVDNEWYRRMYKEPHFEMSIQREPVARTL